MHRWMSTTALDWRGRARGRQVAPSGPRAGSRSARRTPVAQPSLASALSSALPVHLMQWMAAKRCVAVAANAGTTVCTAGTWNSPTAGQALLGTALHRAAAGLRCAIPPRLSIQPEMEPGRLRRWRPHRGGILPCPALPWFQPVWTARLDMPGPSASPLSIRSIQLRIHHGPQLAFMPAQPASGRGSSPPWGRPALPVPAASPPTTPNSRAERCVISTPSTTPRHNLQPQCDPP